MFTRTLFMPSLALSVAVAMGLFSQTSAATEEIVVYGHDLTQAREALFRSSRDEFVRAVSERVKVTLDENLKEVPAPKLLLAESETPTRG